MRKKTTNISDLPHMPLEVEWRTHHPHVVQPDGKFKQIEEHVVALLLPADKKWPDPVLLVSMTPKTSYNLYKWLHNNIETIKALAGIEDENGQSAT
jgi:hypothetical protein